MQLEALDLSFRYSRREPWVLRHCSLAVERGERLGRKLSATGNGQGNVTNLTAGRGDYCSFSDDGKIENI